MILAARPAPTSPPCPWGAEGSGHTEHPDLRKLATYQLAAREHRSAATRAAAGKWADHLVRLASNAEAVAPEPLGLRTGTRGPVPARPRRPRRPRRSTSSIPARWYGRTSSRLLMSSLERPGRRRLG